MRILYGVQGTGNGHTTRARIMARALEAAGAQVDWVFSGREAKDYFDMDVFGQYQCYRGLTFVTRAGRVLYPQTLLSSNLKQLYADIRQLDLSGYDLVLNDFEPITAWAARRAGLPVIGLSHQAAFQHAIPKRGDHFFVRQFMRHFAPVDRAIGFHWHHFNQPILPPLVEPSHYPNECQPGHYLVYLPFADPEQTLEQLRPFSEQQFYVYQRVDKARDEGHLHIRPFCREGFQADLHRCEGVICSAGFELSSEAIQLGKKLLVQPVVGQMEQQSNALALSQLGYGAVAQMLTRDTLANWFDTPRPKPIRYPDVGTELAQWLVGGEREPFDHLQRRLWQAVPEPAVDIPSNRTPGGADSVNMGPFGS